MGENFLHDILLHNIDTQDKRVQELERKREELLLAYHTYEAAYDEFRETIDVNRGSAKDLLLAFSKLIESERDLGHQAQNIASSSEVEQQIDTYRVKLEELDAKFQQMKKEELFGESIQDSMRNELRELTGQIETTDETIHYLVNRLFEEADHLTPDN